MFLAHTDINNATSLGNITVFTCNKENIVCGKKSLLFSHIVGYLFRLELTFWMLGLHRIEFITKEDKLHGYEQFTKLNSDHNNE
jgi:hypothetical protein